VIVVLGRPTVHRPEPDGELMPSGLATEVARALARAGASVELAGAVGDDPEGDRVVVELGRVGIGHAAILRDPAAHTPPSGGSVGAKDVSPGRALPRLEAADVELALGYLAACDVLVVAEPLDPEALDAAMRAAEYHAAAAVVVADAGAVDPTTLGARVTLLERPSGSRSGATDDPGDAERAVELDGDDGVEPEGAFAGFIADYSLRLDRGEAPERAFAAALGDSAWEPAPD